MSIGSLFVRIKNRLLLEVNACLWRLKFRKFRSYAPTGGYGGTILFCDLMAMIAGVKFQSVLAAALAPKNWKVVVLLHRRDPIVEKLYLATNKNIVFYYLDEYVGGESIETAEATVKAMMNEGSIGFEQLLNYQVNGIRVGRNALSIALRKLRSSTLDLSSTAHKVAVYDALIESLKMVDAAKKLVNAVKPDRALFNERGYTPAGEVFDECLVQGCDAIQWFGAPTSDALMFTRYNLRNRSRHPLSITDQTWDALNAEICKEELQSVVCGKIERNYDGAGWYNRQNLQEGKRFFSREELTIKLGIDPNKKTAVIFTHILYDATFFYGESLFKDYHEWLIETVRCALENSNLNWLIKVHPVNVWRSKMDGAPLEQLEENALRDAFGELPDHIKILPADTKVNTWSLFELADFGLTVRGTVGMELPCLGKPVITAGTGRYSERGFTVDPATKDSYRQTLLDLHLFPTLSQKQTYLAQLYYYASFFLRPYPLKKLQMDYQANTWGLRALSYDFKIDGAISSHDDLNEIKDLINWIVGDEEKDLLIGKSC